MADMTPPGQQPGTADPGSGAVPPPAPPQPPQPVVPSAPAGWYPDSSPGVLRYWDGTAWTDHRAPGEQPPAPGWSVPDGAVVYPAQAGEFAANGTFVLAGRRVCTPWERLGAYLLDSVLALCTLGIGWLIWACFTAPNGQTPAKKLLDQRVYRLADGRPADFGWMLGMRGIVGGLVFGLSFYVLAGFVLIFMPLWDNKNQTFVDKVSSTVVLKDPA